MVRERKTHVKDIEKLHDLIDSASLPKQKTVTIHNTAQLEELRKRLSEESFTGQKPPLVVPQRSAASEELKPRVIVHKKIEPQEKTDKKVIQIDLGPRPVQKEHQKVNFSPIKDDPFAKEPLFEIEKTPSKKKTPEREKTKTTTKKTQGQKEFIPVSPPKKEEELLPEFQPVSKESTYIQPPLKTKKILTKKTSQMGEPMKEEQKGYLTVPQAQQNVVTSFEPVDFLPTTPAQEKKEPMQFEMPQKAPMSRKQKKIEEKKAKQETKEKEKKLKIETKESELKQRQEKKQKELDLREAFVRADEQEREEERLLKEQEKKSRLEIIERQKKEKEDRKQKKIDEKKARLELKEKDQEAKEKEKNLKIEARETEQKNRLEQKQKQINEKKARLELKEKKREAKRLAKEHDRKLKLEWIEFRHKQRQNQKQKDFEQKKEAVESKEKEQEEQRLLKEREQKLRFDQAALAKKEKEGRKQKKIEEKKARLETKIKEHEAKKLTKEKQLKIASYDAKQKQQEEQKQKEIEKKLVAAHVEEKQREEQQLLKEMEEKSHLELLERQKKEKEKQKTGKIKKEKKPIIAPLPEPQKKDKTLPLAPSMTEEKPQKPKKKLFGGKKEEQIKSTIWESYDEKPEKESDSHPSITAEEIPKKETQKQLMKERKHEQKRLAKEQKEKERQDRLETKKKEKKQKIQQKIEEKQRRSLFGPSKGIKQIWEQNPPNEKLSKKEAKEKEREARRLLKEEQKRKDRNFALKEIEAREKEKDEQKQKQITEKKDREHISRLSFGKAKTTGIIDERKQAEQQRQTMDLVRIAAEEKELRKTKAFERKMQKEQRKREKEEQKYKAKAEEKAKKNLEIHMKEEVLKEKMANPIVERTDPFIAFDSIDPEIAGLLSSSGIMTVEQLRQMTVKDLMKSGIKKKIAQRIIAECSEFVEWQVFDSIEHF